MSNPNMLNTGYKTIVLDAAAEVTITRAHIRQYGHILLGAAVETVYLPSPTLAHIGVQFLVTASPDGLNIALSCTGGFMDGQDEQILTAGETAIFWCCRNADAACKWVVKL